MSRHLYILHPKPHHQTAINIPTTNNVNEHHTSSSVSFANFAIATSREVFVAATPFDSSSFCLFSYKHMYRKYNAQIKGSDMLLLARQREREGERDV